jgi:hypothetical protein
MAAGTDDKRFEASCRGVSNDNDETRTKTHVEVVELCQREHTRWHVDEAVAIQLSEKTRECVRYEVR